MPYGITFRKCEPNYSYTWFCFCEVSKCVILFLNSVVLLQEAVGFGSHIRKCMHTRALITHRKLTRYVQFCAGCSTYNRELRLSLDYEEWTLQILVLSYSLVLCVLFVIGCVAALEGQTVYLLSLLPVYH